MCGFFSNVAGHLTNREFLFKDTYNPKPEKIYDPSLAT